jgi:hypothetical protein
VLDKLEPLVWKELEKDGYSPLLKVACLLVDKWDIRNVLPQAYEELPKGSKRRITAAVDVPRWIGAAAIKAQCVKPRQRKRGEPKLDEAAEHIFNAISSLLKYDWLQYLKKKNNVTLVDVDQLLADINPGLTPGAIKKQRERAKKFNLEPIDGEDYLVFDVNLDYLVQEFQKRSGLRQVIR